MSRTRARTVVSVENLWRKRITSASVSMDTGAKIAKVPASKKSFHLQSQGLSLTTRLC